MDAVTRVEETVALTAYVQALVKHYSERFEAGGELPSFHRILISENKWLGARYGLEAPVIDLATGRRNRVPIAQLIRRTLRDIEPHARELGAERELEGVRDILAKGNGADRQLRVFNANRDIVEVAERDRGRDGGGRGGNRMISVGDTSQRRASGSTPRDEAELRELAEGSPYLLLFYLFDWSST